SLAATMDLFRVRLNCIDHYQATPTRYDPQLRNDIGPAQAKKGPKVPVVRVFGSTETGQKVCAHIHGAFPYLYVEYQGSLEPEDVGAYIYRLHLSIDHALAVSYRRDQYADNAKFVARITLVKGVPFYGFHVGYRFFLKIYMFNPIVMTRLADLLQQGVILKKKFQPYEAHLQYLLQFMTDYNLYGCGYLDASDVYFRGPIPSYDVEGNSQHLWHDHSIPRGRVLEDLSLPRVSHCSVEVDICVQNIINRRMVKERRLHHDFVERVKPLPADVKLVYSMAGLWKDETRRRKLKMPNADPGSSPFPAEVLISMSANARDSQPQGWIHEEEYQEEVVRLIEAEKDPEDTSEPNFDTFVEHKPLESKVKTALQSVEDLYPTNLLPALGLPSNHAPSNQNPASSIEVDEQGVLELEGEDFDPFPVDSDEEALMQLDELGLKKGDQLDPAAENENTVGTKLDSNPTPKKVRIASPPKDSTGTENLIHRAQTALGAFSNKRQFIIGTLPPVLKDITSSLKDLQIPDAIYQDAYYSEEKDVPPRPREYAGREFRLESNTLPYLADFDPSGTSAASVGMKPDTPYDRTKTDQAYEAQGRICSYRSWEIAQPPPSSKEVQEWWEKKHPPKKGPKKIDGKLAGTPLASKRYLSQIDGPTPKNKHGFKYSPKKKSTSVKHEAQYMSTMALEVHVNTRGKFVPNPEEDEVQCIFWSIKADGTISASQDAAGGIIAGVVVLSPDGELAARMRRYIAAEILEESSELDLMVRMVEIVRAHDPDILTGYEVHGSSWGYLIERARLKYDYDLCDEFSRMKSNSHGRIGKENDRWGFNTTSTIRVTGRHMINIWRAMRGELNLLQYTMENVVWHVLHRRIPHYSWRTLTEWYKSSKQRDLDKLLRYYLARTRIDIQILESNELIPRTSEQARLLGVDFFSVFSRGSQFKVESIMFRIAKPENFMLVSPSRKQVGGQNALECLPLVMEPQSAFYNSPLLVLDFQSLYPSVMIAYNLCYSTFLGRIVNWRGMNKMGFTEYQRHKRLLELLKDHINITPNGMMYVRPEIRKSLLAKMLGEILETRVMVKSGMKQDKDDKTLQQLLNNRQLALKLLANVTYGYTSASFSGRMPCSEIADSIVQTGRETLERAIAFIHSQERWGAEVVYGDTDSLFVYLKGRTKDQAFDIGNEIAKAITDMNPRPIKLKFEKVYHPCVLLAKKRYVGYKYESKDQVKPDFDAKGIETVRRDGTPAEQKIEEKALKILFETANLSEVKSYFQKQCEKIMRGSVSVQDFCYAREVKLGTYSDKGPPPPGALISTKRMLEDARAEPQYGERVPYVVITGAPGARLIDRCVAPEDLLKDSHSQLDAEYYISKNLIPPLERIFNLVGANVRQWYDEMPKVQRIRRVDQTLGGGMAKKTLESYLKSASCISCNAKMQVEGVLCPKCEQDAPSSLFNLQTRLNHEERKYMEVCSRATEERLGDGREATAAMGGWTGFLFTYLLGGLTFIPLVVVAVFVHAYLTLPYRQDADISLDADGGQDSVVQPGDDLTALQAAKAGDKDDGQAKRPATQDNDVAAGYFAVCREYTPMGINAKPIERATPTGSTTVAAPSQSVYQTMYKSIFERKPTPGPLDRNGLSQRPKNAGNVFYVVLRHGHLMLFDDDEQIEVRHVISLAHHDVSIYSGGDVTPEGELYIKRNALCLSRRPDGPEVGPDSQLSKPFYLFSENCSAKEDFYFALLRNQEQTFGNDRIAPKPKQFEVKNIISLVQKLHSSEEHLSTRWLNAMIGRIFLGIYKTTDLEHLIREKLTKKIARVKRPSFLTNIAIRGIETGESAPIITNPRHRDLNVEGECVMEADVRYTGNFRIEVAATARIDLGSRFKVREVDLVLAVVLKKLEGHMLFKIKPPPSNRIWLSFQSQPKVEMTIEPIVSARQITYTIILRQIENRIKEVIAETLVQPFWDDMPFFNTEHKKWRGGIWEDDDAVVGSPSMEAHVAQEGDVEGVDRLEDTGDLQSDLRPSDMRPFEKSHSMPIVENSSHTGLFGRKIQGKGTSSPLNSSSTSVDVVGSPTSPASKPKPFRSPSVSSPANPVVGTDAAHADMFKPSSSPPDHASSMMAALSARSQGNSAAATPTDTPAKPPPVAKARSQSSASSREATDNENETDRTPVANKRRSTTSSAESLRATESTDPSSPTAATSRAPSIRSATGSISKGLFRRDTNSTVASSAASTNGEGKRTTLAAVANAAVTARQWGWNALQKHKDAKNGNASEQNPPVDLNQPMGRGQPLPPPGTPLPPPVKGSKVTTIPVQKRKPISPPELPERPHSAALSESRPTRKPIPPPLVESKSDRSERRPVPPPPLPSRRHIDNSNDGGENMLVVEAPLDSEPTTPMDENGPPPAYVQPWAEDTEDYEEPISTTAPSRESRGSSGSTTSEEASRTPPPLPERRASPIEAVPANLDDDDDYSAWMEDDNTNDVYEEENKKPIITGSNGTAAPAAATS
ncbi:DNA polymerase zeta catalytic subunit, partial [Colletotrichum gloeosporioides]